MPLGAAFHSLNLANPAGAPEVDYGTYQGYFRSNSTTTLGAYNTSDNLQAQVTHGCGTLNYVRAKRIPGTSSHIVGVSGASAIKFYRYTSGTFVQLSTLTAVGRTCDIAFDTTNNKIYMAATRSTTPFIAIYQADLSDTITSSTQLSNPSVLPAGVPQHIRFSNDGNVLLINHATTPFMRAYTRSGATFTSITPPSMGGATVTNNGIMGISWNADDTVVAYSGGVTTLRLATWNGTSFGSSNNSSQTNPYAVSFNPNPLYKNVLLVSNDGSSGRVYYNTSGTSVTATSATSSYYGESYQWSPDGLRTLFNQGSSIGYRTDAFNTSYTTSTVIGTLLGTRNTFTIAARGFDWMYH